MGGGAGDRPGILAVPPAMKHTLFYLGLATLFTHELDAMPNHEWRGMPVLGSLPDDVAVTWFVLLHVPLFAGLIALVASRNPRTRILSRLVIGAFLVVHGLLHYLKMGDPAYEFSSFISNALIFGGAALGAAYLALEAKDWRAANRTA
jgi:hypothetical protein